MKKWYILPELDELDNYDKCMVIGGDNAVYCWIYVHLKPDNSSELWSYIEVSKPVQYV